MKKSKFKISYSTRESRDWTFTISGIDKYDALLNAIVKVSQRQFDITNDMKKFIIEEIKFAQKLKQQSYYFEEKEEIGISIIFWFERFGKNINYGVAYTNTTDIDGMDKFSNDSFWITECKKIK